jgi:outer membrane protein
MKNAKKTLLGLVLSMFVLSISAQTDAGGILIGGSSNMGFSATTDKYKSDDGDETEGKGIDFNLSPQAGYFVMDGLAVGLMVDLGISTFKQDGAEEASTFSSMTIAPFARYYYGESKIKPFAEAAVGFGSYAFKFDGDKDKTGVFFFQLKLGAAFFVNDNVSIDLGLSYASYSEKDKENNDINRRDITSGIGFEVGISVIL